MYILVFVFILLFYLLVCFFRVLESKNNDHSKPIHGTSKFKRIKMFFYVFVVS